MAGKQTKGGKEKPMKKHGAKRVLPKKEIIKNGLHPHPGPPKVRRRICGKQKANPQNQTEPEQPPPEHPYPATQSRGHPTEGKRAWVKRPPKGQGKGKG